MWVESTMTEMWLHAGTVLPENLAPFAAGFYFIGDFCRKTNVSTAFSERFSGECLRNADSPNGGCHPGYLCSKISCNRRGMINLRPNL